MALQRHVALRAAKTSCVIDDLSDGGGATLPKGRLDRGSSTPRNIRASYPSRFMPRAAKVDASTQTPEQLFSATVRTAAMSSDRSSVATLFGPPAARYVQSTDEWGTLVTFNVSRIVTDGGRDRRNLRR